jgi:hypothetical protein
LLLGLPLVSHAWEGRNTEAILLMRSFVHTRLSIAPFGFFPSLGVILLCSGSALPLSSVNSDASITTLASKRIFFPKHRSRLRAPLSPSQTRSARCNKHGDGGKAGQVKNNIFKRRRKWQRLSRFPTPRPLLVSEDRSKQCFFQ